MGIDTFIYREHAYSKKGAKVIGLVSGKKYKRCGLVAGKLGKKIIAPLQYNGSIDSALFELWFNECFIPSIPPSSTVILDNASFHRKSKLISIVQNHGHRIIFLPPYSPNLNQMENFWAWLKAKLKKVVHMFDDFDEALCYCFGVVWVYLYYSWFPLFYLFINIIYF